MTEILFRDNPGFKGVKDEFDPSVVVEEGACENMMRLFIHTPCD